MKVISPLYGNFNQLVYSNSLKLPCTYQVAKIIFEQGTCDAITKELKKCPGALNRKFSPYLLTPSHLAVIGGNAGALEALHAAKAKMDELDFQGYTPLHHAAMKGDFAAVSKLLNWGANPNRLNVFGGTYMDLLRLNQPFRSNKEEVLDANLFSVHTNEQYQVDQTCLAPDVKFIHENVATPKQLIQLWKVPAPGITLTNDEANSAYENYAKNPPPLAIQSLKNDKGKEMCGVVALRPIKKGEIIAEYTGKIVDPQEKYDEVYSWDAGSYVIDAGQYRSAASMINAGPWSASGCKGSTGPNQRLAMRAASPFRCARGTRQATRTSKPRSLRWRAATKRWIASSAAASLARFSPAFALEGISLAVLS